MHYLLGKMLPLLCRQWLIAGGFGQAINLLVCLDYVFWGEAVAFSAILKLGHILLEVRTLRFFQIFIGPIAEAFVLGLYLLFLFRLLTFQSFTYFRMSIQVFMQTGI